MNTHIYRIVFNQMRGIWMVVAEVVSARGKLKSSQKASVGRTAPSRQVFTLTRSVQWALLAFGSLPFVTAQADIVADPGALATQQPLITHTANGVPLVNIQTPDSRGLSHNTYQQFDVMQNGVILNNSRTNIQTQLGGWVQGNPSLAAGTASTILNEVHSSQPSLLNGFIEVAGSRAQVIVANPSGISCNGCGFINAWRATLTTGSPVFTGGDLSAYRVTGGVIQFLGTGMDTSAMDYTDIISRAVVANAGVWAKTLNVVLGTQQVNVASNGDIGTLTPVAASNEPVPQVALDVAALGGMYAGKIHLIGTELGLGVRNAGNLVASAGPLVLNLNGRLENSQAILAQDGLQIQANELINRGIVQSNSTLAIDAGTLNNQAAGTIASEQLSLNVQGQLLNDGQMQSSSSMAIRATTMYNSGSVRAGSSLNLNTDDLINQNLMLALGSFTLTADHITNANARLSAGQDFTLLANQLSGDGQVLAGANLNASLQQDYWQSTGLMQADGNLSLLVAGSILNDSKILAGATLTLNALNLNNRSTNSEISGLNTVLNIQQTLDNRGLIDGSDTFIQADTLNNIGSGQIYGDHLALAARLLNNLADAGQAATIASRDRLDLGVSDTLNNLDNSLILSIGDMAIGGTLDATHQATGTLATLNNRSASIQSMAALSMSVGSLNNTRTAFSVNRQSSTDLPTARELLEYDPALSFYWGIDESSPATWRNYIRDSYINRVAALAGGQLDNTYLDSLRALVNNSAFEMVNGDFHVSSLNIWRQLLDKIQADHPTVLSAMAGQLTNLAYPLQKYDQVCLDDECAYVHYIDAQRTDYKDVATGTAASLISAATTANLHIGQLVNQYSTIQSGRDMLLVGNTLSNQGAELYLTSDYLTTYHLIHWSDRDHGTTSSATSTSQLIGTEPGLISAGGSLIGSFTGQIDNVAIRQHSPLGSIVGVSVNPQQGNALGGLAGGNLAPLASLYAYTSNPQATYLIETNSRFASYGQWLSSDYMLEQLGLDPAYQTKRLGDGFYEQKLVREQINQLTGRRFLTGYSNDQAQYQVLMTNGATIAQAWQLVPGVALSDTQVAQLTSDIVWLVRQTVTLPDGTTTQALVPQVYVRPATQDLSANGALLLGQSVQLTTQGDAFNSGALVSHTRLALAANNIQMLGGSLQAQDAIQLDAQQDIQLQGSTTDIHMQRNGAANTADMTVMNRMSTLYTSGEQSQISVKAGHNLVLNAAAVENAGAKGSTQLQAGNDLTLGIVQETQDLYASNKNSWRKEHNTSQIGSQINTQGDVTLSAQQDIRLQAANVQSSNGELAVAAGKDVTITTGTATQQSEAFRKIKTSSGFGSSKKTFNDTASDTTHIGSTLSADNISIQAGKNPQTTGNILVQGSDVVATQDVALNATGNVEIASVADTHQEAHNKSVKKSGFSASGSSVGYGSSKLKQNTTITETTQRSSTIGSVEGDVTIEAGKTYTQTASNVVAPQGDIGITAQKVDITSADETYQRTDQMKYKQSGVSVGIGGNPAVNAAQAAVDAFKRGQEVKDDRLQALYAAQTIKNAAQAVGQAQQVLNSGNASSLLSLNFSIGSSKASSRNQQTQSNAVSSTLEAGNNLNIVATGGNNTPGDITVTGSTLKAGNDMTLDAANDLQLRSAQNNSSVQSKNKSSSASVGVNVSLDGTVTPMASIGGSKGGSNGTSTTHTETTLQAGNRLMTSSGRDTTLKGAVAQGESISMQVGRNLHLESEQDTANFKQKQTSANANLAVGDNAVSGTASAGQNKIDSTYQSVKEQTGLYAGDGGFNINVNGNTHLKGAVIDSSLAAQTQGNNQLTTGTLTTEDLHNQGDYKASASTVGISQNLSLSPATQGDQQPAGSPAGSLAQAGIGGLAVADSGHAEGTTRSAIATGTVTITDNAGQQAKIGQTAQQTVVTLNRDTQHANGNIDNPFNQEKVQEQLEFLQLAGQLAIQPVAAQAAKWIGDTLDGSGKVAAHAALGAAITTLLGTGWQTGAAAGALGDLLPQALEKAFEKDASGNIKNEEAFKAANTLISAALTSATGADLANTINAGMATQNAVENNWLSHQRPAATQLSEAEQYEYAMKACIAGNQSQCGKAHDLESTSKQRDLALNVACADGPSAGCSEMARFAVNEGNVLIKGTDGQIYVVSKDEPLLKAPDRPQGFDQEIAPSIIDAALQEAGAYYVGKLLGAAKPLAGWVAESTVKFSAQESSLLLRDATSAYNASSLSNAGRALTKHPEILDLTKQTLRTEIRTDAELNRVAESVVQNIITEGVKTTPHLSQYGGQIIQIKIPGGFGARWYSDGKFIGFIN
jgi:filamentous hemagglutinin